MPSSSKSLKSPCSSSTPEFEPGSHVMAVWRNNFEYLAEVLAYRRRSHHQPEYRLKFVWDHVIEWTVESRIRAASQSEVDSVLNFCRQHGGMGAGKASAVVGAPPHPPAAAMIQRPDSLVERPLVRRPRLKAEATGAPSSLEESSGEAVKQRLLPEPKPEKQPSREALIEGTVAQGDMLYDRNIAQFHEACRKRRELKRRAIELELSHQKALPIVVSINGITSLPTKRSQCSKRSHLPFVRVQNLNEQEGGVEIIVGRDSGQPLNCPEMAPEKPAQPSKVPSSPGPLTFQCPHCPRRLRRYSLLAAHLKNYHKPSRAPSQLAETASSEPGDVSTSRGQPGSPRAKPSPEKEGLTTSCSRVETAASLGPAESPRVSRAEEQYLLYCHRCRGRGAVQRNMPSLVQCFVCRAWAHRACYDLQPDADPPYVDKRLAKCWLCDGCARVNNRSRGSRMTGLCEDWVQYWSRDGINGASKRGQLFRQTMDTLNWIHQLSPLLVACRHSLGHLSNKEATPPVSSSSASQPPSDSLHQGHHKSGRIFCLTGDLSREVLPSPPAPAPPPPPHLSLTRLQNGAADAGLNALLMELPVMNFEGLNATTTTTITTSGCQDDQAQHTETALPADVYGLFTDFGSSDLPCLTAPLLSDMALESNETMEDLLRPPNRSPLALELLDTPTKAIYSLLSEGLLSAPSQDTFDPLGEDFCGLKRHSLAHHNRAGGCTGGESSLMGAKHESPSAQLALSNDVGSHSGDDSEPPDNNSAAASTGTFLFPADTESDVTHRIRTTNLHSPEDPPGGMSTQACPFEASTYSPELKSSVCPFIYNSPERQAARDMGSGFDAIRGTAGDFEAVLSPHLRSLPLHQGLTPTEPLWDNAPILTSSAGDVSSQLFKGAVLSGATANFDHLHSLSALESNLVRPLEAALHSIERYLCRLETELVEVERLERRQAKVEADWASSGRQQQQQQDDDSSSDGSPTSAKRSCLRLREGAPQRAGIISVYRRIEGCRQDHHNHNHPARSDRLFRRSERKLYNLLKNADGLSNLSDSSSPPPPLNRHFSPA